jgi:chemotaxis protein MotB
VLQALEEIGFYQFKIDIEGHTDDVPISTARFPSNWELSVSRASNVVKYFIAHDISPDRLKASGYADTQPIVPNRDSLGTPIPENRARNRRIVIRIYY